MSNRLTQMALAARLAAARTATSRVQNVFEKLAEHEMRFARLNVLRKGWREQCSRPDVDPGLKQLVEGMLDAIDQAVDRPA